MSQKTPRPDEQEELVQEDDSAIGRAFRVSLVIVETRTISNSAQERVESEAVQLTSIVDLNSQLKRYNAPFYESVATSGIGVQDTLKAIFKHVLLQLTR